LRCHRDEEGAQISLLPNHWEGAGIDKYVSIETKKSALVIVTLNAFWNFLEFYKALINVTFLP